jgi:hypothetical protein
MSEEKQEELKIEIPKQGKVTLRKGGDGEVFGPMSMPELEELAAGAYVAPEDQVSFDGEHWVMAHEVAELDMFWMIVPESGEPYGPTTIGTLKEFYLAGEITAQTILKHTRNGEQKALQDVLGEDFMKKIREEEAASARLAVEDKQLEPTLELAKDLHIRQLETDLKSLRQEHERLLQKCRRLEMEQAKRK